MSDHSIIAPSSAHRWVNCTASPLLSRLCQPQPENEKAKRGTMMHAAAVSGNLEGLTDQEQGYVNAYRKLLPETAALELPVGLAAHPLHFGTIDAVWWENGHRVILDFKTGRWPVAAAENWQLIGYASESDCYGDCGVKLGIFQPQVSSKPTWWTLKSEEYKPYQDKYRDAARRVFDKPEICEGEWCKFCPAKGRLCDAAKAAKNPSAVDW